MPLYNIEFNYKIEEYGDVILEADNEDQADEFTREYIRDVFPDAMYAEVTQIKLAK